MDVLAPYEFGRFTFLFWVICVASSDFLSMFPPIYIAQTNWTREALTEQKKLSARFPRELFETFTISGGDENRTIRLKELRRQTSETNDTPGRYHDPETRRKANFPQYSFVHEPVFFISTLRRDQ